ncbi:MAG: VIT1/CCC1 transporter family protein, partial [Propionibacteriaceae bacterium]|nr:VIT1/CCC1 transporter family protein [Propionibacteriaceae bacterium]
RTRSLFEADPLARRAKLAQDYVAKGVDPRTAEQFVAELRDSDVEANALSSLGIDADRPVSPWVAAGASFVSFTIGALIPLLAMAFTPPGLRLSVTVAAVVAALVITGFAAARLSSVPVLRPIVRNVVVGMAAMNVTYLAGSLFQLTL